MSGTVIASATPSSPSPFCKPSARSVSSSSSSSTASTTSSRTSDHDVTAKEDDEGFDTAVESPTTSPESERITDFTKKLRPDSLDDEDDEEEGRDKYDVDHDPSPFIPNSNSKFSKFVTPSRTAPPPPRSVPYHPTTQKPHPTLQPTESKPHQSSLARSNSVPSRPFKSSTSPNPIPIPNPSISISISPSSPALTTGTPTSRPLIQPPKYIRSVPIGLPTMSPTPKLVLKPSSPASAIITKPSTHTMGVEKDEDGKSFLKRSKTFSGSGLRGSGAGAGSGRNDLRDFTVTLKNFGGAGVGPGVEAKETVGPLDDTSTVDGNVPKVTPHRSESLPVLPVTSDGKYNGTGDLDGNKWIKGIGKENKGETEEKRGWSVVAGVVRGRLEDLPSNPKLWTPSQLALYLSHVLKLGPKPLIADVTRYVVSEGLTGRRFLRLREQDLENMGINIAWRKIMSQAREKLRRECLRGRIFGFGTHDHDGEEEDDYQGGTVGRRKAMFLDVPKESEEHGRGEEDEGTDETTKRAWKNSWRRTTGRKSKGRVKGMAKMFEESGHGQEVGSNETSSGGSGDYGHGRARSASSSVAISIGSSTAENDGHQENTSQASTIIDHFGEESECTEVGEVVERGRSGRTRTDSISSSASEAFSASESEAESVLSTDDIQVAWDAVEPLAIDIDASEDEFRISSQEMEEGEDIEELLRAQDEARGVTALVGGDAAYRSKILRHGADGVDPYRAIKRSSFYNPKENDYRHGRKASESPLSERKSILSFGFSREKPEELEEAEADDDKGGRVPFGEEKEEGTMKRVTFGRSSNAPHYRDTTSTISSLNLETIQTPASSGAVSPSPKTTVMDLFALAEEASKGLEGFMKINSRDGSMVIVKKSHLKDLQMRVDELERRLEGIESSGRQLRLHDKDADEQTEYKGGLALIPHGSGQPIILRDDRKQGEAAVSQMNMAEWVMNSMASLVEVDDNGEEKRRDREMMSLTGLGGYVAMAGLGIGIVCGEFVVDKMFGFRMRR